jgi:hypothetical protein
VKPRGRRFRRTWPRRRRNWVTTKGTCPTRKARFAAEVDTRIALADAASSVSSRREETRHYRCTECGGWHLTSWPQWTADQP